MPSPYDYSTPQVNVGTYFDAMREGRADRLAVETEQRNNALAKYLPQALNGNEQAQAMAMQSAPVDQMANLAQSFRGMKAEELAAKRREQAESASLALWADTPEKWAIANAEAKKKNPNTPDIPFEQRGMLIAQGQSVAEMLKQAHDEKILANDTSRTTAQNAASYASAAASRASAQGGLESWGQEDIDYAAYIYNHTGQMPPLGQGKDGSSARKAILKSARIQATSPGQGGAANTVANFAEFAGTKAGLRTLGGRAANIDTAAAEAKNFAGQAVEASKLLPRGSFVPLNQLVQAGQVVTSDKRLAYFATKALGLAGAAATVAGRGTTNQFLQEEYFNRLSTAPSSEAFEETARAILEEAKGVSESTEGVRQDMLKGLRGGQGGHEAAPPPPPGPKRIKYDTSGRRIQ